MSTKLVIWGLYDVLDETRAAFIRQLNKRGIVSAICASAGTETAADRLRALKLADQTVFNRTPSGPKGPAVRAILNATSIAPQEALFVTARLRDREEANFFCPGLRVADPASPDCDAEIGAIIAAAKTARKSKRAEYARLEKEHPPSATTENNEAFLRDAEIKVVVVRRGDCFDFATQIAALVGHTTAAEIEAGLTGYYRDFDCRALFATDKYGGHGLAAFAAVQDGTTLRHFAISPRVAVLGIGGWFVDMLRRDEQFHRLDLSALPIQPAKAEWITWEPFKGPTRVEIIARETGRYVRLSPIRIIADHQSAPLAHFAGLSDVAEADMQPHNFELRHLHPNGKIGGIVPAHIVYLPAGDYDNGHAPWGGWKDGYPAAATRFCEILAERGTRTLLVLPPEQHGGYKPAWGLGKDRIATLNKLWRDLARQHEGFTIVELDDIAADDEVIDIRHYKPSLLRRIGEGIATWFQEGAQLKAAE